MKLNQDDIYRDLLWFDNSYDISSHLSAQGPINWIRQKLVMLVIDGKNSDKKITHYHPEKLEKINQQWKILMLAKD